MARLPHIGTVRDEHTAQKRRRFNAGDRGMTLVEVLAVVVILGLLASVLLIGFSGSFGRAKQELAKTGIGVIAGKVELYRIEENQFPSNEQGLAILTDGRARPADAYYLSPDQLLDPWDRPYIYLSPGPDGHPYEIVSYGADGQPGGEDENADISSVSLRSAGGSTSRAGM